MSRVITERPFAFQARVSGSTLDKIDELSRRWSLAAQPLPYTQVMIEAVRRAHENIDEMILMDTTEILIGEECRGRPFRVQARISQETLDQLQTLSFTANRTAALVTAIHFCWKEGT